METKINSSENHIRSWLKAISWRIFGTLTTFGATFSFTHNLSIATAVGSIELVAKIILFYLHERLWIRINRLV